MHKETDNVEVNVENTAQAFLELLALRGIDCFFGNAGTDFASIVDAFARREKEGKKNTKACYCSPMRYLSSAWPMDTILLPAGYRQQWYMWALEQPMHLALLWQPGDPISPCSFFAGRTPVTEEGSPASTLILCPLGTGML